MASALALVSSFSTHILTVSKPDLVVAAASASVTCSGPTRIYLISVTVSNRGTAPSSPQLGVAMVSAQDSGKPPQWLGNAGLGSVAPNASTIVNVPFAAQRGGASVAPTLPLTVTVNSGHWVSESDFTNNSAQISVIRSVGCQFVGALSVPHQANAVPLPSHLAPPPNVIYHLPSGVTLVPATTPPQFRPKPHPPDVVAAPTALNYTTDPTTCVNHVGLLGALICQQIIAQSGLLLLIWNWSPCNASYCIQKIQGYHIYNAPPPPMRYIQGKAGGIAPVQGTNLPQPANAFPQPVNTPPRTPLDTQTDPGTTIRGIQPFHVGQCFVVTAYNGKSESPDSNTFCVGGGALVAAPWYLRYVPYYSACADPAFGNPQGSPGQPGYDMCTRGLDQKHLVLTWNWNPCAVSAGCTQNIDGYNVYRQGSSRVGQQPNSTIRGADVGPFQAGQCYTVTAYHTGGESVQSAPFCVTQDIIPTPPPPPTPTPVPMNVFIDITDDSYPADTIVGVGGTVTWQNDDTDVHDIYFDGGSFYQELSPGERAAITFTRPGVADYLCHYHAPYMRGRITVVAH